MTVFARLTCNSDVSGVRELNGVHLYFFKKQVIALIAHLRSKNVNGPFLVTAPLATLPNWVNEFRKWLPCVDVLFYHGSKEHRQELRKTAMKPRMSRTPTFPIVVTSYEVCLRTRVWVRIETVQ